MRKIALVEDEKRIACLMLNNQFVFQHGSHNHGWWPDRLYTVPTDEVFRYDIEMSKNMGFNLARKHVKVEPDRRYYWCDNIGLLGWQDMPSGDAYIGTIDSDYILSNKSGPQYTKVLQEMIREKFNHPSIIVWVPFNEGWHRLKAIVLGEFIKEYDPSRLVDVISDWADRKSGDINDVYNYHESEMPEFEKLGAVFFEEYGGLDFRIEVLPGKIKTTGDTKK